jgi:outer membrane protein assembly factor BamD (BamD/ComL family)
MVTKIAKDASNSKAARALSIAQKIEKAGNPVSAVRYYKEVVRDYPKSPSATEAAARIKAFTEPKP